MRISFVEIQNFRKLKSIRVDFSKETTVFVGANNSGKTSAMMALNYFLIDQRCFVINDFTLSNLSKIDEIGAQWEKLETQPNSGSPSLIEWNDVLPSLDTWLHVEKNEIHHVSHILPTLDWTGGLLGIRLRFEPENIKEFYKEYTSARKQAKATIEEAKKIKNYSISLWPANMTEFLEKKLHSFFTVRPYILDPFKISQPRNGIASPQPLSIEADPIEGSPFKGLSVLIKLMHIEGFLTLANPVSKRMAMSHLLAIEEGYQISYAPITKNILIHQVCPIYRT